MLAMTGDNGEPPAAPWELLVEFSLEGEETVLSNSSKRGISLTGQGESIFQKMFSSFFIYILCNLSVHVVKADHSYVAVDLSWS